MYHQSSLHTSIHPKKTAKIFLFGGKYFFFQKEKKCAWKSCLMQDFMSQCNGMANGNVNSQVFAINVVFYLMCVMKQHYWNHDEEKNNQGKIQKKETKTQMHLEWFTNIIILIEYSNIYNRTLHQDDYQLYDE